MTEAYDQARKEFYRLRHREDVERRVANEEAQAVGAYFGKSMNQVGMELEDAEFERWKEWATKEVEAERQSRGAMYSGADADSAVLDFDSNEGNAALEEVKAEIPAQGQDAMGNAPFHP